MKKLILIALLLPALAQAEITPTKGILDSRVRVVNYNALDVVKLTTYFGVSTQVQFGKDETITAIAVGDDKAWQVVDRGNTMFIKPKEHDADTNVTVITNRRNYQFALVVQSNPPKTKKAWANPNLIYSLTFAYPEDEALKKEQFEAKDIKKAKAAEVQNKLKVASNRNENNDYWVAGSEEISPTKARDDGRFTYLTFGKNRDVPAIYEVDALGHEVLIPTNVMQDSTTVVIQRLFPKLVLRKDPFVASVINKSFDIDKGKDNTTGTISDDVVREVKEIK